MMVKITFSYFDDALIFLIEDERSKILEYQLFVKNISPEAILYDLLRQAHILFYSYFPQQNIEISCSNTITSDTTKGLYNIVSRLTSIFYETNNLLKKLFKFRFENTGNFLFYNVDEHFLLPQVYASLSREEKIKADFKDFESGFDPVTRNWGKAKNLMAPEELMKYLIEKRISKIYSINMYLIDEYLFENNLFILSIFKHLNIEYVVIDWDIYCDNNGYLKKAAFNYNGFRRYSVYPLVDRVWNQYLEIKNVKFFAAYGEAKQKLFTLNRNYNILCAVNSRVDDLLFPKALERALFVFQALPEEKIFYELQLWFFVIRFLIAGNENTNLHHKLYLNQSILKTYFDCITLLKYEAVSSIQSDRKIYLYGDCALEELFPKYYQKDYLTREELLKKLQTRNYIYLHVNSHLSYTEANQVIFNSFQVGVPFVGFPAVVKTPDLSGLSYLEYKNIAELNQKLENINQVLHNSELEKSLTHYNQLMNSAYHFFLQDLIGNQIPHIQDQFYQASIQHRDLFLPLAVDFLEKYQNEISKFMRLFTDDFKFNIESSKYFNRDYVQYLIHLRD